MIDLSIVMMNLMYKRRRYAAPDEDEDDHHSEQFALGIVKDSVSKSTFQPQLDGTPEGHLDR